MRLSLVGAGCGGPHVGRRALGRPWAAPGPHQEPETGWSHGGAAAGPLLQARARIGHGSAAGTPQPPRPHTQPAGPATATDLGERPVLAPDTVASAPPATMWLLGSYCSACGAAAAAWQQQVARNTRQPSHVRGLTCRKPARATRPLPAITVERSRAHHPPFRTAPQARGCGRPPPGAAPRPTWPAGGNQGDGRRGRGYGDRGAPSERTHRLVASPAGRPAGRQTRRAQAGGQTRPGCQPSRRCRRRAGRAP